MAAVILILPISRTQAGEACQPLILNKCAACHFVTHICPRIEKKKGSLSWKSIVNDMVKEGMAATGQEQAELVRCLADPDAEVRALCPAKR